MSNTAKRPTTAARRRLVKVTEPTEYTFDVTVTDPLALQTVVERGEINKTGRTGGIAGFLGPMLINLHTIRNKGMWPADIHRTPAVAGNDATEPEPGRFVIGTENRAIRRCLDETARELETTRAQVVASILTMGLQAAVERTPPPGRIH